MDSANDVENLVVATEGEYFLYFSKRVWLSVF